jgi:hypothetical protein
VRLSKGDLRGVTGKAPIVIRLAARVALMIAHCSPIRVSSLDLFGQLLEIYANSNQAFAIKKSLGGAIRLGSIQNKFTMSNLNQQSLFVFIPEADTAFFQLFPYRFDYIYANQGFQPAWRTETRHALSDRLIDQGAHLFGVRFGFETRYAMIDIDGGSLYHPNSDPLAIGRMIAALEPLGIVATVPINSSYSGGLHLYFPLDQALKSWELGTAIGVLLARAGFAIAPGQLEIFPNRKTSPEQRYNAHRLPLQSGSYLLDDDFCPVFTSREEFVRRWQLAAEKNDSDQGAIDQVLKLYHRQDYRLTKEANKFLQDLDAEIEVGWTAHGQTNHILGRIALRGYVFAHVVEECDRPLEGRSLANYICDTARRLPGFTEWCRHQGDLVQRAWDWVRSVEASPKYFHYGTDLAIETSNASDSARSEGGTAWNMLQSQLARLRISEAIGDLLDKESLPTGIRERLLAITNYGISPQTLYNHLDLWHPEHLADPSPLDPSPAPDQDKSLLPLIGWITAQGKVLSDFTPSQLYKIGWIIPQDATFSDSGGG